MDSQTPLFSYFAATVLRCRGEKKRVGEKESGDKRVEKKESEKRVRR